MRYPLGTPFFFLVLFELSAEKQQRSSPVQGLPQVASIKKNIVSSRELAASR